KGFYLFTGRLSVRRPAAFLFHAFQHPAAHLVQLDRLEQGLEVAFAEAFVSFALDDLEEDRPDLVLGEDLQQQAAFRRAVQQYLVLLQPVHVLAVVGQAAVEQLVIGVGCVQELQAGCAQLFDRAVDVVGGQRDVLDAFAAIQIQVFLDLAFFLGAFLVDRNADIAAGRRHGLGLHAGDLAFDVEVAYLAEVEQAFVELGPFRHAALVDVMGKVVDDGQAGALVVQVGLGRLGIDRLEIHIVDADVADAAMARFAVPAVHQVNQGIAYSLDGGDVQFHGAAARVEAPGAQFDGALVGLGGIVHPEGNRTDRRAVQPGKALGEGVRFRIDQEVDAALAVKGHVLVAVAGNGLEAQGFEYFAQRNGIGRGVFNEFEAGGAHGVVPGLEGDAHVFAPEFLDVSQYRCRCRNCRK